MFRPELVDRTHDRLVVRSHASFEQLLHHVRAAQDAGWHTSTETRQLAGALWAMVHGLAMLWSQHALPAVVPGTSLDEMLTTAIDLVLEGPSLGNENRITQTSSPRRRGSIRRGGVPVNVV
jgi:hypothetical protein